MAKVGRPSSERTMAARFTAKQVLETLNQNEIWLSFLNSDDEKIKLEAWKYLNDRVHGRPQQALDIKADIDLTKRVLADL